MTAIEIEVGGLNMAPAAAAEMARLIAAFYALSPEAPKRPPITLAVLVGCDREGLAHPGAFWVLEGEAVVPLDGRLRDYLQAVAEHFLERDPPVRWADGNGDPMLMIRIEIPPLRSRQAAQTALRDWLVRHRPDLIGAG